MTDTKFLTLEEVANRIGVGYASMRVYHQRASRNRREGNSKRGDLPLSDQQFGRSPVWKPKTIDQWLEDRPGRGRAATSL